MKLFRCAVFTINNYTTQDIENLKKANYQYLIFGQEKGDSGTPHLQGYIEFDKQKSLRQLKKINEKAHWEKRFGSQKQAIDYCKKENNFEEFGQKKQQGKRNDLIRAREIVKNNNMRKLLEDEECPNLQQIKVCEKYLTYCESERNWKPEVTWIHGESEAGKSKLAHEMAKNNDTYIKDETQWWDGYDKHETIIIDDFRSSQMKFTYLLKLLDRYSMRVQVKGGFRQFLAKKIIITSIEPPEKCYNMTSEKEPLHQLLRRIDKTIHLKKPSKVGVILGPDFNPCQSM